MMVEKVSFSLEPSAPRLLVFLYKSSIKNFVLYWLPVLAVSALANELFADESSKMSLGDFILLGLFVFFSFPLIKTILLAMVPQAFSFQLTGDSEGIRLKKHESLDEYLWGLIEKINISKKINGVWELKLKSGDVAKLDLRGFTVEEVEGLYCIAEKYTDISVIS